MEQPRPSPWSLLKEVGADWSEDKVARLSAALAYYTLLSMAPLLVIAVAVAGFVFGEEAARGGIAREISALVGPHAAAGVQTVLQHARAPEAGLLSTVVGLVVLLFGASGVFGELQSAMNTVWEVAPKPGRGIWGVLKDRFFSFTMVLGVAFLLLVSLIVSAVLSAVGRYFAGALPGGATLWQLLNVVISLGIISSLFALIFKFVPDAEIAWKDVFIGAGATALLFTAGKFLLGLYLGRASFSSAYGAAGSVVVLVAWVYYSAQILFLGAEITQVYSRHFGSRIRPRPEAVSIGPRSAEEPGLDRPLAPPEPPAHPA